jgi:hypothetical protein
VKWEICSPTPSGFFSTQSAESPEKKRVEFCVSAKKCRRMQKSAEECEKKELEYGGE